MFAGPERRAESWAVIASLIETCKLNGVDPQAWLADVLARIAAHPAHRRDELPPWNWAASGSGHSGSGGLTMHVNKVSHVRTIDRVARDLGEDVDWLFDVALEMEPEDGVIRVRGLGDESVIAFTDFGVDDLVELIEIHRDHTPREKR